MKIEARVKEHGVKKDFYNISLKTYKQVIEGDFERSEIRHLIQILDNAINVGEDNHNLEGYLGEGNINNKIV